MGEVRQSRCATGGRLAFKLDLQPVGFLRLLRVGSPGAEKNHFDTLLDDGAVNLSRPPICICDYKLGFTV